MSVHRRIATLAFAACLSAMPSLFVCAAAPGADYVRDKSASSAARAYFKAVPEKLEARKVVRATAQPDGEDDAYFTDDGAISIPPRGMVAFKMSGRCMDPHLPAPAAGEPMQFVDRSKLIPQRLRQMYDNLVLRMSQGDPRVAAANPQHLVWAIRTAGTDDPLANNLSDAQLEILDECSGRRGAFLKYHEKEKRRNARKSRRGRQEVSNRVAVGGMSYDASELRGTNAVRQIESHIATLTEMGQQSKTRTSSDFRYGEIEEEMYSDIVGNGGLSFAARIINASDHRKEFRAADFVAQVGNGSAKGGMRQRVTMGIPDEFMSFAGAVVEGVEIDHDISIAEIEGRQDWSVRGRSYRRRSQRSAGGHSQTESETSTTRRTRRDETTTVTEITPVSPVSPVTPVPPVVIRETVTNDVVRNVPIAEEVKVRVVSLEYDSKASKGGLTVEIVSGSFRNATEYIRKNFDDLIRRKSPAEDAAKIPTGAKLEIETLLIKDDDRCEAKFVAKESRQ